MVLLPHSHSSIEDTESSQTEATLSVSDEKKNLASFVEQVLGAILRGFEYNVKVISANEQEAIALKERISTLELSQFYVLIEAKNISEQVARISKFTNKNIFVINSNLICWAEGECVAISSSEDQSIQVPEQFDTDKKVVFRKSKTVLPLWLDKLLFEELCAQYAPEHTRFEYNLDLNEDELKVYLGTYFPRSYAEMFCIFDNIFQNNDIWQLYKDKKDINIFDFGCGTGGELIGLLSVMDKYFQDVKILNIVACDGNNLALDYLRKIIDKTAASSRHTYRFHIIHKEICSLNDLDELEIPVNSFDIEMCDKVGCEFISHGVSLQSYECLASFLSKRLSNEGLLVMLDVTTKCEETMMFYPQMMNVQINDFVRGSNEFETLLPLSCATYKDCKILCFTQQTFWVTHMLKKDDESRVSYRVLCHKGFKGYLMSNSPVNNKTYIINPIRYQQGTEGAYCNNSKGYKEIRDSFNMNI